MRISRIDYDNMINGPGIRAVVWFQGCNHYCDECHNKESWFYEEGHELTEKEFNELFEYLSKDYVSGVTFSGGDPFYVHNRSEMIDLCINLHKTGKSIWVYTGFMYEQISTLISAAELRRFNQCVDVVVDGMFDKTKKVLDEYRGSSNQRIIDVKKSKTEIVEWKSDFDSVR